MSCCLVKRVVKLELLSKKLVLCQYLTIFFPYRFGYFHLKGG